MYVSSVCLYMHILKIACKIAMVSCLVPLIMKLAKSSVTKNFAKGPDEINLTVIKITSVFNVGICIVLLKVLID